MLERGKIISSALLMLGEVREYNNNNYEIYIVAQDLIEEVLIEFSVSQFYVVNLDYRRLTKTGKSDPEGRIIYNGAIDAISYVRAAKNESFEEIGECIHSYSDDLIVLVNRKISLAESKDIYFTILKLRLCKKLAEVYPQFREKLPAILQEINAEEIRLSIVEGAKHLNYIEENAFGRGY